MRNPNWYGKQPAMDEVIFRFYADDNAQFQALQSGELDALDGVPEQSFASIENSDTIEAIAGNQGGFSELAMNSGCSSSPGDGHPALLDKKVRQAINYAIDRDLLVEKSLVGHGIPGTAFVPVGRPVVGSEGHRRQAVQVQPRQGQCAARRGGVERQRWQRRA